MKAPEQIFASKQSIEAPTSCVISFTEPSDEYSVQYTRTDVAQAQVAAAYEAAAMSAHKDAGRFDTADRIRALTPTDARAALDRIVQEAVKEALQVNPLVWHKSHCKPWNGDWHTYPTGYTIRCADENGWKWSYAGGVGYAGSDKEAKIHAQAHHEARILAALKGGEA